MILYWAMENWLILCNQTVTFFFVIPLIFIIGLYYTFRLRAIQCTRFFVGLKHLLSSEKKVKGNITNFQAISTVLAGNLGTGNISGMAIALHLGGPGSLVWMWIMAFLGAIIKYAGCFLGFQYRELNKEGEYVGGPMYYLHKGLKAKVLSVLFSIFCIMTAFSVGNLVQVHSVILPFKELGMNGFLLSILLTCFVAVVIMKGITRFAVVAEIIVPFMGFIYLIFSFIILYFYWKNIGDAIKLIFTSAFHLKQFSYGALSFTWFQVISAGFERGIFATDAGLGIAPILQSSAKEKNQVLEGYVGMLAPFFILIICTITVLVLIVTGAWVQPGLESTTMCTWAFKKGLSSIWGFYIISISLLFFAYTTILAWAVAGSKATEFLFGLKYCKWFKIAFLLVIPFGSFFQSSILWPIADICVSCMLMTNLMGVIGLSKEVIKKTEAYEK